MKMRIDIVLHLVGITEALWASYTDDVDAEGTMVAKYVRPLVDAATDDGVSMLDGDGEPLEHGHHIIAQPWRIAAITYSCAAVED